LKKFLYTLFILAFMFPAAPAQEKGKTEGGGKSEEKKSTGIVWHRYDDGLKMARENGKHILVNFTAKWCGYCGKMNRTTFSNPEVVKMLSEDFVTIKVHGDSKKELNIDGYKITERKLALNEYHVRGYPAYWFLKSDGKRLGVLPGYRAANEFLEVLYFMKAGLYDKMTFDEYIKKGGRKEFSKG
jgi:thioredoxin-related protein